MTLNSRLRTRCCVIASAHVRAAQSGTDTLRFIGVDPEDLRIWSDSNYAYFGIAGNSLDWLRLSHQSIYGGAGQDTNQRIERIVFDDSTVWDLTLGMPMTDTDDAHSLFGTPQNDMLDGRGGADALYGRNGNDTLYGGAGADTLSGDAGDDTYYFEAGFVGTSGQYDTLSEGPGSGTDTLRFIGVNPEDLRIWSDTSYAYFGIAGNSLDVLRLSHQSIYGGSGQDTNQRIERIVFDDSTVWDLTLGMPMTDTDDAHSLFGTPQNDMLDGRGGADTLYGRNGDDVLVWRYRDRRALRQRRGR